MAEEETIFDLTLKKKKKKKKTTFDIDAALAEGTANDNNDSGDQQTTDKENQEPTRGENEFKDGELDEERVRCTDRTNTHRQKVGLETGTKTHAHTGRTRGAPEPRPDEVALRPWTGAIAPQRHRLPPGSSVSGGGGPHHAVSDASVDESGGVVIADAPDDRVRTGLRSRGASPSMTPLALPADALRFESQLQRHTQVFHRLRPLDRFSRDAEGLQRTRSAADHRSIEGGRQDSVIVGILKEGDSPWDGDIAHQEGEEKGGRQEPSCLYHGGLDLENFGKKKKKKKKPFNMEELDGALPEQSGSANDIVMEVELNQEDGAVEEELDLDMVFSTKTKKKKKKKPNLDELLVAEEERIKAEDKENVEDSQTAWFGQDRDYTYDELLTRVFDIMRDKNPDMVTGKKQKFVMRPPQVVRIGTKKTSFANFTEICKTLHRQPKHLLDFLLAELGTSGSVDGNNQLIIKGRFQQKQIENVLRRYIKEYVTCHTCRSPDTILQKDTRLFFLQCETCGSRCSVASIKSGFQVTMFCFYILIHHKSLKLVYLI
uniref:Eukaryotic translation initiation factor 2 subunit 2 n=1 Tax=Timema cristinae TaxID=61476 RepID=A0A7R9D1M6_TIMCR|nr:unnamed protein product [Timema cristinae]